MNNESSSSLYNHKEKKKSCKTSNIAEKDSLFYDINLTITKCIQEAHLRNSKGMCSIIDNKAIFQIGF